MLTLDNRDANMRDFFLFQLLLLIWSIVSAANGQPVDPIPDISVGDIRIRPKLFSTSLPVEQEFITPVFTQRVGPTDFAEIPNGGGNRVITTYGGFVFLTDGYGNLFPDMFLDLGTVGSVSHNVNFEFGDAHGLTTIVFHPDFANQDREGYGHFYTIEPESSTAGIADFSDSVRNGIHHQEALYEYQLGSHSATTCDLACVTSKRELLRVTQPGWHHNLGDMAFDDNSYLYVSSGDGSTAGTNEPVMSDNSRILSNVFGKILRIDPLSTSGDNDQYGIPSDNPFSDGVGGNLDEIYAYGLRNPYRISFDSLTGDLFTSETGELAIESVNKIKPGGNHGWNLKEGSFVYDRFTKEITVDADTNGNGQGDLAEQNSLVDPVLEYDRQDGVAIIGGVLYRGNRIPELKGHYVFADFTGRLFYGNPSTGERFEFQLADNADPLPFQIHSINQDAAGELYVLGIRKLSDEQFDGIVLTLGTVSEHDCNNDDVLDVFDANCANENLDQILVEANLVKGDADGDGMVQFGDFITLSNHFGLRGQYTDGDFDLSGEVQFPDFVILSSNFGKTSSDAANVPEPTSIVLTSLMGIMLSGKWRQT